MQERTPRDFLTKADVNRLACVDERREVRGVEQKPELQSIPVKIPGATYGIADALKTSLDLSESESWELIQKAGIPIRVHLGPEHGHGQSEKTGIGSHGCGYANLVEKSYKEIGVPEPVSADERLVTVMNLDGQIYSVVGEHKITHATIVWMDGMSIDSEAALKKGGIGVLDCDPWAAGYYADLVNKTGPGINLDREEFMQQIVSRFRFVVKTLAPDVLVEEIKNT